VLAATLAACGLAGELTVRALVPGAAGLERLLAWATLSSGALVACVVVPGALGLLWPAALPLTGLVLVAAAAALTRPAPPPAEAPRERASLRHWLLPGGAALLVAACAIALVRGLAGLPIAAIDAQNFQVPIPARWIQAHSVWGLHQYIADYSNATYPHNGNALIAAVMAPFDSPFLARLVAIPFWVLSGVAVVAMAERLGARRPAAVLAATAFLSLPIALRVGLDGAQTDMPMLAWLGTGGVFLLRHRETGARGDLVVAGVGLGLALGKKWYALTALVVVLAVWALARRRDVVRPGVVVLAFVLVGSGFWFVRNWVRTGNPLFPQALPPLFDAPPDPLRELGGFTIAHYLFDFEVWRDYLWPAMRSSFGLGGAVLAIAAVAGARRAPWLALAALGLVAAYFVTPFSAFGPEGAPVLASASTRYCLPALMAAAVVAARVPWAAPLLAIAVLDGVHRGFDLSGGEVLAGLVVAGAAAVALRRPRAAIALAVAAGLLLVAVSAHRTNRHGYGELEPVLGALPADGRRVGVAGVWTANGASPVLAAFGPRLGNRVAYVGGFREGMLRAPRDATEFAEHAQGFDVLVIGRPAPPRPAREEAWAARAGFEPVASSPRLALYARRVSSP
jgi:hypothetical protein